LSSPAAEVSAHPEIRTPPNLHGFRSLWPGFKTSYPSLTSGPAVLNFGPLEFRSGEQTPDSEIVSSGSWPDVREMTGGLHFKTGDRISGPEHIFRISGGTFQTGGQISEPLGRISIPGGALPRVGSQRAGFKAVRILDPIVELRDRIWQAAGAFCHFAIRAGLVPWREGERSGSPSRYTPPHDHLDCVAFGVDGQF
jgi:hypothetical protein